VLVVEDRAIFLAVTEISQQRTPDGKASGKKT